MTPVSRVTVAGVELRVELTGLIERGLAALKVVQVVSGARQEEMRRWKSFQ
jgi:hypothetical protein